MSSKPSSPFLSFACVGEVDDNADFAASARSEGGVEVQYPSQGGDLSKERELREERPIMTI